MNTFIFTNFTFYLFLLSLFFTFITASGVSSFSKAKSQSFDPFADLGNIGSTLPGVFFTAVTLYQAIFSHMSSISCYWLTVFLCSGSTSAGFSGSGFKTAPSAGGPKNSGQQWQQTPRPSSGPNKPWMPPNSTVRPQTVPQAAKPNYKPSFSVIGGRQERGIRGPGFGMLSHSSRHKHYKPEFAITSVWEKKQIWVI